MKVGPESTAFGALPRASARALPDRGSRSRKLIGETVGPGGLLLALGRECLGDGLRDPLSDARVPEPSVELLPLRAAQEADEQAAGGVGRELNQLIEQWRQAEWHGQRWTQTQTRAASREGGKKS